MNWKSWNGNDTGPDGYEGKKFHYRRRDGNVGSYADWMPWAVGSVDWRHNPDYPDSDIVAYAFEGIRK